MPRSAMSLKIFRQIEWALGDFDLNEKPTEPHRLMEPNTSIAIIAYPGGFRKAEVSGFRHLRTDRANATSSIFGSHRERWSWSNTT